MELTDAQRDAIEYFGLMVVLRRLHRGDWYVSPSGSLMKCDHDPLNDYLAIVRPRHTQHDDHMRQACDEITKLQAKVRELESELAPIRAMEVGSWELAVAIEDLVAYFQGDEDEVAGMSKRINRLQSLAARFRKGVGDGC